MKNAAIIIFAIGVLLTVYTSFNLVTREKVVDIGTLEISADKNNYFAWSPIIGVAVMLLGAGVFFFGTKKS
jgi:predicted metal-binding membrane protein